MLNVFKIVLLENLMNTNLLISMFIDFHVPKINNGQFKINDILEECLSNGSFKIHADSIEII